LDFPSLFGGSFFMNSSAGREGRFSGPKKKDVVHAPGKAGL